MGPTARFPPGRATTVPRTMRPMAELPLPVVAFSHVGISVTDFDRAIDFYTRVLGFRVVADARAGGHPRVLLAVDDVTLELLTPDAGPEVMVPEPTTFPKPKLTLTVPDAAAAVPPRSSTAWSCGATSSTTRRCRSCSGSEIPTARPSSCTSSRTGRAAGRRPVRVSHRSPGRRLVTGRERRARLRAESPRGA